MEEGETMQCSKGKEYKWTNKDLQTTKQETIYLAIRTPLKLGDELTRSGRVSSSYFTSGTSTHLYRSVYRVTKQHGVFIL